MSKSKDSSEVTKLVLEARLSEGAKVAARSLERIKRYSSRKMVQLAKDGDALREKMLRDSAEAWVKKK